MDGEDDGHVSCGRRVGDGKLGFRLMGFAMLVGMEGSCYVGADVVCW